MPAHHRRSPPRPRAQSPDLGRAAPSALGQYRVHQQRRGVRPGLYTLRCPYAGGASAPAIARASQDLVNGALVGQSARTTGTWPPASVCSTCRLPRRPLGDRRLHGWLVRSVELFPTRINPRHLTCGQIAAPAGRPASGATGTRSAAPPAHLAPARHHQRRAHPAPHPLTASLSPSGSARDHPAGSQRRETLVQPDHPCQRARPARQHAAAPLGPRRSRSGRRRLAIPAAWAVHHDEVRAVRPHRRVALASRLADNPRGPPGRGWRSARTSWRAR